MEVSHGKKIPHFRSKLFGIDLGLIARLVCTQKPLFASSVRVQGEICYLHLVIDYKAIELL